MKYKNQIKQYFSNELSAEDEKIIIDDLTKRVKNLKTIKEPIITEINRHIDYKRNLFFDRKNRFDTRINIFLTIISIIFSLFLSLSLFFIQYRTSTNPIPIYIYLFFGILLFIVFILIILNHKPQGFDQYAVNGFLDILSERNYLNKRIIDELFFIIYNEKKIDRIINKIKKYYTIFIFILIGLVISSAGVIYYSKDNTQSVIIKELPIDKELNLKIDSINKNLNTIIELVKKNKSKG